MEQVQQQQLTSQSRRKPSKMNNLEEMNENISQDQLSNQNKLLSHQFEMLIHSNSDRITSKIVSDSSNSSQSTTSSSLSSTKNSTTTVQNQFAQLSSCRNAKASKNRECMQNTECFEENTTHHNTSQSSLNTSSISCSSTSNLFETFLFTRPPAPSSTSSTRRNQGQYNYKPRILYEEQEEDIDEVQVPSESEGNQQQGIAAAEEKSLQNGLTSNQYHDEDQDNQSDNSDQNEEQQRDNEENDSDEDDGDDQFQNDSVSSNSYIDQLKEAIIENSFQAKLMTNGSSCSIYSLAVNLQNSYSCEQQQQTKNVVLKTSFHSKNSTECSAECDKLGKEFFVLSKFKGHPYIIQAYLLEHNLNLPSFAKNNQVQTFPMEMRRNCCLVMEEATCDLITYFTQRKYETMPHHHYKYLLNKNQYRSNYLHPNMGSSYYSPDSSTKFKNSFYNCFPGIFYDILTGLEHVHTKYQLAHNDLKPENMLFFGSSSSAKLCDFELCGSQRFDMKRTDFTYQSPEIVEIYKEYRDFKRINNQLFEIDLFKNDVFSFGVTLFSTMFGFYPFCDEFQKNSSDDLYSLLISADSDEFWQEKEISRICQAIEANTNSSYLYNFQKFIEETLEENPSNRIDTSSLMNHDFFEEERHYRFEKDLYDQATRQHHQSVYHNGKHAISTKNHNHANSHANKSQFSASKFAEKEESNMNLPCENNMTDYFDPIFFLSPQTKATSIACRSRQTSVENHHLCMRRSHSFELKFDPNKSPFQAPHQGFTYPQPQNCNNVLDFKINQQVDFIPTYPFGDSNQPQEINSQDLSSDEDIQQQNRQQAGNDDEDEKLTKTSDFDCNSSKDIGNDKSNGKGKQDQIDDFFFEDEVEESDEDEEEEV